MLLMLNMLKALLRRGRLGLGVRFRNSIVPTFPEYFQC